jgi:hypothetical protein
MCHRHNGTRRDGQGGIARGTLDLPATVAAIAGNVLPAARTGESEVGHLGVKIHLKSIQCQQPSNKSWERFHSSKFNTEITTALLTMVTRLQNQRKRVLNPSLMTIQSL